MLPSLASTWPPGQRLSRPRQVLFSLEFVSQAGWAWPPNQQTSSHSHYPGVVELSGVAPVDALGKQTRQLSACFRLQNQMLGLSSGRRGTGSGVIRVFARQSGGCRRMIIRSFAHCKLVMPTKYLGTKYSVRNTARVEAQNCSAMKSTKYGLVSLLAGRTCQATTMPCP